MRHAAPDRDGRRRAHLRHSRPLWIGRRTMEQRRLLPHRQGGGGRRQGGAILVLDEDVVLTLRLHEPAERTTARRTGDRACERVRAQAWRQGCANASQPEATSVAGRRGSGAGWRRSAPLDESALLFGRERRLELPHRHGRAAGASRAVSLQLANAGVQPGGLVLQVGDELLVAESRLPGGLGLASQPAARARTSTQEGECGGRHVNAEQAPCATASPRVA